MYVSGIKHPSFFRAVTKAELGDLRRRRWDVLPVGAFGLRPHPHGGRARSHSVVPAEAEGAAVAARGFRCSRQLVFHGFLLLPAPLLLPQQLLGLQKDTSV